MFSGLMQDGEYNGGDKEGGSLDQIFSTDGSDASLAINIMTAYIK